ncbi:MAG TPA: hypothetical protein VF958_07485 [Thermoanaerobaculia bacterium]
MARTSGATKRSARGGETPRQSFLVRDCYTVSGLVVGDICFTCRCRVVEFAGEDGMTLAWCDCEWADDAAEMEVLTTFPER